LVPSAPGLCNGGARQEGSACLQVGEHIVWGAGVGPGVQRGSAGDAGGVGEAVGFPMVWV
jgi:hypothetical protein